MGFIDALTSKQEKSQVIASSEEAFKLKDGGALLNQGLHNIPEGIVQILRGAATLALQTGLPLHILSALTRQVSWSEAMERWGVELASSLGTTANGVEKLSVGSASTLVGVVTSFGNFFRNFATIGYLDQKVTEGVKVGTMAASTEHKATQPLLSNDKLVEEMSIVKELWKNKEFIPAIAMARDLVPSWCAAVLNVVSRLAQTGWMLTGGLVLSSQLFNDGSTMGDGFNKAKEDFAAAIRSAEKVIVRPVLFVGGIVLGAINALQTIGIPANTGLSYVANTVTAAKVPSPATQNTATEEAVALLEKPQASLPSTSSDDTTEQKAEAVSSVDNSPLVSAESSPVISRNSSFSDSDSSFVKRSTTLSEDTTPSFVETSAARKDSTLATTM